MGERLRLVDEAAVDHARHEALALTAVRALQHPGLLQMLSAHKATTEDGREEVVIVTQRAGPSLEEIADTTTLEVRLAIVQRMCVALARLHGERRGVAVVCATGLRAGAASLRSRTCVPCAFAVQLAASSTAT